MLNSIDNTQLYEHIINALKYFDVFNHALYKHEIYKFLQVDIPEKTFESQLSEMVKIGAIAQSGELYSLENKNNIFQRRLDGADYANQKMSDAHLAAGIISAFPFVRCVCISGSLSKGYADKKSDIDFFIITEHKKLWISRTLLHLFKKITFLANKQHSFCMNYFIDESRLCIEEQNIFTATEIATLIPIYNSSMYHKFIQENDIWVKNLLPNYRYKNTNEEASAKNNRIKQFAEWLIKAVTTEKLNNKLMGITDKRWRKKWENKNYPMDEYDIAMKTRWYVSKQHPGNHQKKVLSNTAKKAEKVAGFI